MESDLSREEWEGVPCELPPLFLNLCIFYLIRTNNKEGTFKLFFLRNIPGLLLLLAAASKNLWIFFCREKSALEVVPPCFPRWSMNWICFINFHLIHFITVVSKTPAGFSRSWSKMYPELIMWPLTYFLFGGLSSLKILYDHRMLLSVLNWLCIVKSQSRAV